jgi:uncharacterized repeat protein (TIGR01451 family)
MAAGWVRRWSRRTVGSAVLVLAAAAAGAAPAGASQGIVSSGPLTRVEISDLLHCTVRHVGDERSEWYGDTACGTLLATGGTLYGPVPIPAGGSAAPLTPWRALGQREVTGSGTAEDPYRIVTVAGAGRSGLQVTQTDSYVVGEESYRTTVAVTNTGTAAATARLYRAGDCYLQNSDFGYGTADRATGAVGCTAGTAPGSRVEQMLPLTAGSHSYEGFYDTVWHLIGQQRPFPDTCDCATLVDNGIGLSWDLSLAAGATAAYSSLVTFSPLGRTPLTIAKTADAAIVLPGGMSGYTITVTNPNTAAVPLGTLTDTLGAGFRYRPGTTTGATTADPAADGQTLTWAGLTVPAGGSLTVHFGVTAPVAEGVYTDDAEGTAEGYTVAGTGAAAPVRVGALGLANHRPVARGAAVTTAAGIPVAVTLAATDADGDRLAYALLGRPAHGRLTGAAPTLTYTPAAGFTGPDQIRFAARDGRAESDPATVTITVTPAPTATVAPFAAHPGDVVTVDLAHFPASTDVLVELPGGGGVTVATDTAGTATATVVVLRRDSFGVVTLTATAGAYRAECDLVLQPPEWAPPYPPR